MQKNEADGAFLQKEYEDGLKSSMMGSSKRFESGVGLSGVRTDLIKMKPFTNEEIMQNDDEIQTVYTSKIVPEDPNAFNEMHVEQIKHLENQEMIFDEYDVSVFFCIKDLWNPEVFQSGEMEGTALGTAANYREKVVDAALNYMSARQKFEAMYEGSLKQKLPETIPARQYVSSAVAQALYLPYSAKDAVKKFNRLLQKTKTTWNIESNEHKEQLKLGAALIELGAHMMPQLFLDSCACREFIDKCLQNDFLACLINIRKGQ